MIVILTLILILSISFLIYNNALVIIVIAFASLIGIILKIKKMHISSKQAKNSNPETVADLTIQTVDVLKEKETQYLKQEVEHEEKIQKLETIQKDFLISTMDLEEAITVLESLSGIVTEKTETSANELSESIFEISNNSKSVTDEIRDLLVEVCKGDDSLSADIKQLNMEVDGLEKLMSEFNHLSHDYGNIIGMLENNVNGISEYTQAITDLADKTNILAINASIEAARAGETGKGFRVIAAEVQKLAKQSKDIAENINTSILQVGNKLVKSFLGHKTILEDGLVSMEKSQNNLLSITRVLTPQIALLSEGINDSESLSENVTEQLNSIIVSLQYQDSIRQILNHEISLLREIKDNMISLFNDSGFREHGIKGNREKVIELAKKYFTIKEEWSAFDLEIIEGDVSEKETDLKNVTLF